MGYTIFRQTHISCGSFSGVQCCSRRESQLGIAGNPRNKTPEEGSLQYMCPRDRRLYRTTPFYSQGLKTPVELVGGSLPCSNFLRDMDRSPHSFRGWVMSWNQTMFSPRILAQKFLHSSQPGTNVRTSRKSTTDESDNLGMVIHIGDPMFSVEGWKHAPFLVCGTCFRKIMGCQWNSHEGDHMWSPVFLVKTVLNPPFTETWPSSFQETPRFVSRKTRIRDHCW